MSTISVGTSGHRDASTRDAGQAQDVAADIRMDSALRVADATRDDALGADGGAHVGRCTDGECPGDKVCERGRCVDVSAQIQCDTAQDLGTLGIANTLRASGSLVGASDAMRASCARGSAGGERVFHFQVAEDSRITYKPIWAGNFAAVVDFRTSCEDSATALACGSDLSAIGLVPAGTDVYMVVEMAQGVAGDFTVELTASAQSCEPGDRVCSAGQIEVCEAGHSNVSNDCADTCSSSGGRCTGDECADAITVTGTRTFTGDLGAYTSHFDFDGVAGCTTLGGTNIPTPGADLVFKLPHLTTSDTVTIDAQTDDTNLNRIFVLRGSCGRPYDCELVGGVSETFDFTPSADGTYFVVVDKSTTTAGPFTYRFTF